MYKSAKLSIVLCMSVFVASRLNVPGAWQMPQLNLNGYGIFNLRGVLKMVKNPNQQPLENYEKKLELCLPKLWLRFKLVTYDFPPAVKAKVNRLWGGEWHGQAQKWFLMRLTKDESEINLANGEAEPEFAEWKWAGPEEVVEQAVDYKRPTYEEVIRTFEPYLSGNAVSTKCKSSKW
ncbi:nudix hydrolase 25 [Quercus suber]|uniref:Nudix hydrolase 25 n=1 Tax=Quercus suber TaxID=58331 RepID=A0AAW0LD32_QUESU